MSLQASPRVAVDQLRTDPVEFVREIFMAVGASQLRDDLAALDGDNFLVGGAVRDKVLGGRLPRDLDIVVPNGDDRVSALLGRYGPGRLNRHGNIRFELARNFHIDVIQPRYFYGDFESASETLEFFDASVNAIGVRLNDGLVLDPICGIRDLARRRLTLPQARWTSMSDFESVHLVLRLSRLLRRTRFSVANPELALAHLEKFARVDWGELERLNGLSRAQAEMEFKVALRWGSHRAGVRADWAGLHRRALVAAATA